MTLPIDLWGTSSCQIGRQLILSNPNQPPVTVYYIGDYHSAKRRNRLRTPSPSDRHNMSCLVLQRVEHDDNTFTSNMGGFERVTFNMLDSAQRPSRDREEERAPTQYSQEPRDVAMLQNVFFPSQQSNTLQMLLRRWSFKWVSNLDLSFPDAEQGSVRYPPASISDWLSILVGSSPDSGISVREVSDAGDVLDVTPEREPFDPVRAQMIQRSRRLYEQQNFRRGVKQRKKPTSRELALSMLNQSEEDVPGFTRAWDNEAPEAPRRFQEAPRRSVYSLDDLEPDF